MVLGVGSTGTDTTDTSRALVRRPGTNVVRHDTPWNIIEGEIFQQNDSPPDEIMNICNVSVTDMMEYFI